MTRVNVIYKEKNKEIVHLFYNEEQARKFELACKAREDVDSVKVLSNNK